MKKIDLKKEYKDYYLPSARDVSVVDVPEFQFLKIDGQIPAGQKPAESQEFQDVFGALYGVAYTLKFMSKQRKHDPIDFTVMAMEGLWWTETGSFDPENQEPWFFTMMMMQPAHITPEMFAVAVRQLEEKKPNPAISRLRFERFREGLCIQIMHIGPYAEEGPTLERMKSFARENGYELRGHHHEIYLGDPRRAKPENLRTVLRQPVVKI